MRDTDKCPTCEYEFQEEDDNGCPMCQIIDNEATRFAENRWQQGSQTWADFWEECERIKGKI